MSKVSQAKLKEQEASKYRKKRLYGQVRTDVREIIQTLCGCKGVEIVSGAVCIDHVHLCVSIPPKMSVSSFGIF
nr:IS200/IS605 family transposase [uncultured Acetatifactor sp.]